MKYLMLICAEGLPTPDELSILQRDIPAWANEMDGRGVRLFGRELDLPETAATVRVRDGETLVTDGPFAETKEFLAGLVVLDFADLDEAIEALARNPIARFQTLELRPLQAGLRLDEKAFAFGRADDSAGQPYLLITWMDATSAGLLDDEAVRQEVGTWRRDVAARGHHVLGDPLGGSDTATTVRVRDGQTQIGDGPFTATNEFIADLDVVSCADRQQAVELAAAHPVARYHAIEVRPFYCE